MGRSFGGGGSVEKGPFSTSKAMPKPNDKCTSRWQCTIQTPACFIFSSNISDKLIKKIGLNLGQRKLTYGYTKSFNLIMQLPKKKKKNLIFINF